MKVKSSDGPIQCIAAKALIVHDGKVLVLKQASEADVDGANRYHPPGGIVEPGEHLHEALIREVKEETGLSVEVGKIVSVEEWRVQIRGEDCQFFGIFFACTPMGKTSVKVQEEEASGYEWIGRDDIDKYRVLEPSRSVIISFLSANS